MAYKLISPKTKVEYVADKLSDQAIQDFEKRHTTINPKTKQPQVSLANIQALNELEFLLRSNSSISGRSKCYEI